MITAFRPVSVRADGHIDAERMKLLGREHIIDVTALTCVVVEVKGVICLLAVRTLSLMVIEAVKPVLVKE